MIDHYENRYDAWRREQIIAARSEFIKTMAGGLAVIFSGGLLAAGMGAL